ncbi:Tat pathway signal sequence domain protein [Leifsonia shinshuensis]|uniref:Tat pathway signal sequence domain protein n=1 Tax=Leifsonia shinshuensis TaxID=150026 RepID=A0A7G6YAB7_9MICO|nr:Tat pathway signal sequence domain protein [Leifsonia shinshuensis]QNE35432.1 Tat pathway signal sequence domain protein [Leifsonia shinshuensis]
MIGGASAVSAAVLSSTAWSYTDVQSDKKMTPPSTGPLDTVIFGDPTSETAHGLTAISSTTVAGDLSQSARVLNPLSPAQFWGGSVTFTIKVAPTGTTYVSIKLFGGESTPDDNHDWRLQFFINGQSLGYLEQGNIDNADLRTTEERFPGRFFVHTLPLPEKLTQGKTSLQLEVKSFGSIYAYGQNAAQFFGNQTTDSRKLYRAYSHADPYFVPASDDVFGNAPTPTTRANTDAAALATIRARVLSDQQSLIYGSDHSTTDGWGMETIARGYFWKDGAGYNNPDALRATCEAIDGRYRAWKKDATVLTGSDQQWQGFGRVGLVTALLWNEQGFQSELAKSVSTGATQFVNPGFELGTAMPTGWTWITWAGPGTASRDTTEHHTGTSSLKIAAGGGPGDTLVGPSGRIQVGAGSFTYSVWVKTDAANAKAGMDAVFWDGNNVFTGGDHNIFAPAGSTGWTLVTNTITVPAGATQAEIWFRTAPGTTAYFDDLTIVAQPPAQASPVARRDAYTDMLKSSRDYWVQNFRHYSNQAQITAIGIYQANRGLSLLSPQDAWPEDQAREWAREAVGIKPWLGVLQADGSRSKPLGSNYFTTTPAGLTRELGYVGNYGEVTDWLVMLYESMTDGANPVNPTDIRDQIVKMIKARSYFRYFDIDKDGNKLGRLETEIGWRNEVYPGEIAYAERTAWDSNPLMAAVAFSDADIIGWTQEMIGDGQFAPQLDLLLTNFSARVGLNAFRLISRDLPGFQALPNSNSRLPGNWDAPNFLFTDETNGVVAVKYGEEMFYASTYWRARQGINKIARVHLVRPAENRCAIVREEIAGQVSANTYTVPDWVTWDFAINDGTGKPSFIPGGGFPPPGDAIHQALAGDVLALAKIPADIPDPTLGAAAIPGVESMLVGKAPFYKFEYGPYIIGQNTTANQTFTLKTDGKGKAELLTSGKPDKHGRQNCQRTTIELGSSVKVPAMTTVVLRIPDAASK